MRDFKFNCPHCQQSLEAPEEMLGQTIECPSCNGSIALPKLSTIPPPLPAPEKIVTKKQPPLTTGKKKPIDSTDRFGFPNYAKYAQHTKAKDWRAICALNGVEFDSFGTKKEQKVLSDYLEEDEVVFALTSGLMRQTETSNDLDFGFNTWLVVLTSERFLFLDHAMLTSSVDTQSIRHERVQAVSCSQGLCFGKITVDLGARTVVVDNCLKQTVRPIASLANKWLAAREKQKLVPASGATGGSTQLDEIKKLAELHAMGALSDDEFAAAKAKLLASM